MLDRLWNGWRSSYVTSKGASGQIDPGDPRSVFTQIRESGLSDIAAHIVFQADLCFALMNAFPYAPGHLLVLPNREVSDLEHLSVEENLQLWDVVRQAVVAVKVAFSPEGVNVGINLGKAAGGSVPQHLHVHVVPRWLGDSNFMTAVANTRTLPESLEDSAAKIRNAWPRQAYQQSSISNQRMGAE